MANDILREFLIAIGFKADDASASRVEATAKRVERTITESDARATRTVTREAMNRAKAALQEAGVRNATVDQIRKKALEMLAAEQATSKGVQRAIQDRAAARQKEAKEHDENLRRQKSTYADLATAANLWARAFVDAARIAGSAVRQFVGGFDQMGFISQRTGASANNIKGLGYAFSQVGSTAESATQAIEAFAKARRTNPGINGMLRSYGIDTEGDSADVLMRSIEAIQERHPYYTGAQVANLFGITEEQYHTIAKHREAIKAYRKEYAETQRALGVNSDETARASATVARAVTSLTATLGVLAEKLYTAIAPVLERVAKGFRAWIEANPQQVERIMQSLASTLEGVGKGLLALGDWFANDDNRKRFTEFWTGLADLVSKVVTAIGTLLDALFKLSNFFQNNSLGKVLGNVLTFNPIRDFALTPSSAAASELPPGGPVGEGRPDAVPGPGGSARRTPEAAPEGEKRPGLVRRGWNRLKRAFGYGDASEGGSGGDNSPPPAGRPLGKVARNENAQAIIGELKKAGYNDNAIAAIVGSMQTESSFNPRARNEIAGGHTGLWQWDKNRWPRIKKWIIARGGDPYDARWQTRAWMAEHNAKPGDPMYDHRRTERGGQILRNNPTLPDAVHGVRESERFGAGEEGGRANNARKWLPYVQEYKSLQPDAEGAQPAPQAKAAEPKPPPAATPRAPTKPPAMSPGSFDVEGYLRSQPMGASSTSNDNSRSVTQNSPVTVNVQGAGDPQATGAAVGRAVSMANDMSLRNVQTAIR